ncbi:hypothetical protein ASC95_17830 [Pelomonas sp. Root1217]|nr:hypothetical protein ASC95_17830 [Pelomonas sp. Root1217]
MVARRFVAAAANTGLASLMFLMSSDVKPRIGIKMKRAVVAVFLADIGFPWLVCGGLPPGNAESIQLRKQARHPQI